MAHKITRAAVRAAQSQGSHHIAESVLSIIVFRRLVVASYPTASRTSRATRSGWCI